MIRLQMIGVAMVTMVSFLAVIEHHINSIDPGTSCCFTAIALCSDVECVCVCVCVCVCGWVVVGGGVPYTLASQGGHLSWFIGI